MNSYKLFWLLRIYWILTMALVGCNSTEPIIEEEQMARKQEMKIEIIPKETLTNDAGGTTTIIDSQIAKTIGSAIETSEWDDDSQATLTTGQRGIFYQSGIALTTTSALSLDTIMDGYTLPDNVHKLFISIDSQEGASGALVYLYYDSNVAAKLDGVGDFLLIPYPYSAIADNTDNLKLATYAGYECTITIIVWGYQAT